MLDLEFLPQKSFMEQAIALAKESARQGDVPVGAVIEQNGRVIGTGRNRREQKQDALCHAEIEAIHEACAFLGNWRLTGCRLYVTLSPCAMCAGAILNARIERVICGAEDDRMPVGALDLWRQNGGEPDVKLYRGFMERECRQLLQDFFRGVR